jgi:hypothetical protein
MSGQSKEVAMNKVGAWVSGILIALCILGLMAFGQNQRQAYWARRALVMRTIQADQQQQPDRIVIWRIHR